MVYFDVENSNNKKSRTITVLLLIVYFQPAMDKYDPKLVEKFIFARFVLFFLPMCLGIVSCKIKTVCRY